MNPRLCLLAGYRGSQRGSFIPMLEALSSAAARRDWSVEMLFLEPADRFDWYEELRRGGESEVGTAPPGGRRETAAWLAGRLARPGPMVLHTHFTDFDLPAAAVARGRESTAVLWHIHTPLGWRPAEAVRNMVKFGLVGRTVDAILAAGPDPARGVIRAGAPRGRVEVVGGGIDTGRFQPSTPTARRRAREALGVPEGTSVLLHLAWNWFLKDGDLFLASVRELLVRDPGAEVLALTVKGGQPAHQTIARLGLEAHARPLASVSDIRDLYAAADVFVSSSRVEGQPFAVIEAILSGLPVVATNLRGHRDICAGLPSCRLVERSPGALATAISELLARSPAQAEREAVQAREQIASRFDLDTWSERMFSRYERALDERG